MKRKLKWRRIWISAVAVIAAAAIGIGVWLGVGRGSREPVFVYPFSYVGMTEYWGDSRESYGPVTTDRIQTVFVSETQTITEILVAPGDTVQKGDLLLRFDTTLTDLQLERERLGVERLKLQLEDAEDQLAVIGSMVPMVVPQPDPEAEEENLGAALKEPWQISDRKEFDGSSMEKALICWAGSQTEIGSELLEAVRQQAQTLQNANAAEQQTPAPQTAPGTEDPAVTDVPEVTPSEPPVEAETVRSFYMIIKVTDQDRALGEKTVWQGLHVTQDETGGWSFRFFDAAGMEDYTVADDGGQEAPEIDFGSGFTAAEIAEMRAEQEKVIRDLEFDIRMAEAEYRIMLAEMEDGCVYADIDGEVVSVLPEEEAKAMMQPILKVSGGGGFYVEATVGELEREDVQPGMEVTVNDWNTGMVYTGIVESVSGFPAGDGYFSGMGNPNSSWYPMRVFVDESADLQAGSYVSVMYDVGTSSHGVYLENPFLREENGRSYVMVQSGDGTLEQRFVTTGKSLWGSYTEILEGLGEEDFIAFPYGKHVKPGAPVVEGDYSDLYGY